MLVLSIVPFYDFFAVSDALPLTVCINCSVFYIYICCLIARFKQALLSFCTANAFENEHKTSSAYTSEKVQLLGPIFETEWSTGSNCVSVPNFVAIGPTVAEIWRFFDFSKMAAVRHLGFIMCVFGPPTKGIWWSLSLCKIWLASMQ